MNFLHLVAYIVFAYAVHELGHFLTAEVFGIRTKGFLINRRGIGIIRERGPWFDSMVVALGGPLTNIAVALAVPGWGYLVMAQLCVGLLNLFPWEGSDGARVLECWDRVSNAKRNRIRKDGFVDEIQVQFVFDDLAAFPGRQVYAEVKTQADAERLYERLFHAGADTSRVTISIAEKERAAA